VANIWEFIVEEHFNIIYNIQMNMNLGMI